MEDKATKPQLKLIHQLLSKGKLTPRKPDIVSSFTNGRETSSKEMTWDEAKQMITWLLQQVSMPNESSNRMRRKIISLFHRMNWEDENGKADMKRINDWCVNKSYLHKPLMKYSYNELVKLVSQVQSFYTHTIKDSSPMQ